MKTILSKLKKWKSKKAAADLISIIVSVVLISALVLGVMLFLSNKVRNTAMDEINNTMNTITGIAEANRNNADIVIPGGPGGPGGGEEPEGNTPTTQDRIIPEGAYYFRKETMTLYEVMPEQIKNGDAYIQGDYIYIYRNNGWGVDLATEDSYVAYELPIEDSNEIYDLALLDLIPNYEVTTRNETSYGVILESINGKPVTRLRMTFYNCKNLIEAPVIPSGATDIEEAFWGCISLTSAPTIPNNVTNMINVFGMCTSLVNAPIIPNNVELMEHTFADCTSLTEAPAIPNSVTNMWGTFYGCTNLTGNVEINANPSITGNAFKGTIKPITITGSCSDTIKAKFAATANNGNVTY